jgi:hypothetical protein
MFRNKTNIIQFACVDLFPVKAHWCSRGKGGVRGILHFGPERGLRNTHVEAWVMLLRCPLISAVKATFAA